MFATRRNARSSLEEKLLFMCFGPSKGLAGRATACAMTTMTDKYDQKGQPTVSQSQGREDVRLSFQRLILLDALPPSDTSNVFWPFAKVVTTATTTTMYSLASAASITRLWRP
jgi:hypothetical protein